MSIERWFEKEIAEMLAEIAASKNEKELSLLFDRILTPRELNDMGRRFAIIKLLAEGKSYAEIQEKLQISSAVIAKVSNKIGYGFRRSNRMVKKTSEKEKSNKTVKKYKGAVPIHKSFTK